MSTSAFSIETNEGIDQVMKTISNISSLYGVITEENSSYITKTHGSVKNDPSQGCHLYIINQASLGFLPSRMITFSLVAADDLLIEPTSIAWRPDFKSVNATTSYFFGGSMLSTNLDDQGRSVPGYSPRTVEASSKDGLLVFESQDLNSSNIYNSSIRIKYDENLLIYEAKVNNSVADQEWTCLFNNYFS